MKVALLHELLTMRGGAEKVLRILAEMFPDAPIYTLLYDEKKLGDWFPKQRVRTSILQPNFQFSIFNFQFLFNHHLYLKKFPHAVEAWDFSDFDLVISTSSAFAHGIITNGKPKHLSIINSPARYLWDRTHDVQREAGKGLLGPLKKWYLSRIFHHLRIWDSEAADRADKLLAASKIVQRRIQLYWRRESEVLYPPIDDYWFSIAPHTSHLKPQTYLIVSSLVRYKRIEIAIEACNALKLPLTIVGEGPDKKRLQSLAGPTVTFAGYASQEKLAELYAHAKATIFPGDEDFGLVPLESMACGTPVIAFAAGGALETIIKGGTGEFFREPTAESLQEALKKFEASAKHYSREACIAQAKKFSRSTFEEGMRKAMDSILQ